MAKISQLKAQKNKKRVNVYLDGQFAFGLDADNLLKAGLKVGQELTEKEVEDLVFKNESQKLLDKAYRLLSFRPRSEKEVRDYLKKRKIRPRLIEWLISQLKTQGYLNDEKFAQWWLEQRATFRPRGKRALRQELRQKGVAGEVIEAVVGELEELPLAKKSAQKKARALEKLDRQEFQQKLTAYLSRQGFSWPTIKLIIDEMIKKR